ncbi:hypothetical protein G5I_03702 [Acromyrmex echinatior]|uniref:BED-type domain-containing protein n=1 Tax=Acromyrmex echinatior TaxID=103372 RepID=F4WDP5_ACREC|nr:hypothetical protein G5I_03702 [Acromyrmex echinatior]
MAEQEVDDILIPVRRWIRGHYTKLTSSKEAKCNHCNLFYMNIWWRDIHPDILSEEEKKEDKFHWTWDYFIAKSDTEATCKKCDKTIKYHSVTNLKNHLKRIHKIFNPNSDRVEGNNESNTDNDMIANEDITKKTDFIPVRLYIRKHYTKLPKNNARCNYCNVKFTIHMNRLAILHEHLVKRHPDILLEEEKREDKFDWCWDYYIAKSDREAICKKCDSTVFRNSPATFHERARSETLICNIYCDVLTTEADNKTEYQLLGTILAIVCFRDCADAIIQTIDRVEECQRYLKGLMNDAMAMSRTLKIGKKMAIMIPYLNKIASKEEKRKYIGIYKYKADLADAPHNRPKSVQENNKSIVIMKERCPKSPIPPVTNLFSVKFEDKKLGIKKMFRDNIKSAYQDKKVEVCYVQTLGKLFKETMRENEGMGGWLNSISQVYAQRRTPVSRTHFFGPGIWGVQKVPDRVCIKVVIPFELIGVYEFSRSLSGPSFLSDRHQKTPLESHRRQP